jgi:hypothetical protein
MGILLFNDLSKRMLQCQMTGLLFCLPEGVQLLCLIDKAADACRYLQTYGEWNQAAWLAKVGDCSRWFEHLGLQSSVLNLWLVIWMHGLQTVLQITF